MDFKVVYNSYTIGGSNDGTATPVRAVARRRSDVDESTSVDFLLVAASVSAYATAEATMLAALTAPEKALLIASGATTLLDHDPADTTGFLLRPEVIRVDDAELDGPNTKRWRFTVRYQVPAPSAENYLRDAQTSLSYDAARRRAVSISGTYTAGGGSTARANYDANYATFAAAELGALGGTYQLASEGPVSDDHHDGLCTFVASYLEVIYTTSVTGARIESASFARRRQVKATPTRATATITFSCAIDKTVATDLDAAWNSVRAALLTKAGAVFGANVVYVERETRVPDVTASRLAGALDVVLAGSGFGYRRSASVEVLFDAARRRNVVLAGTYQATDGGNSAEANHDADADTWCSGVLTTLGGDYELTRESLGRDDDNQELTFRRVYEEVLHTTGATAARTESFGFRRVQVLRHGRAGEAGVARCIVTYAGSFDSSVSGKDALVGVYHGTVRPALLSRAVSQWGGTAVVEEEDVDVAPDRNAIAARLTVMLRGATSDLLDYGEAYTFVRDPRRVWRKLWDGAQDSYHYWSLGHVVLAIAVVTSRRVSPDGVADAEVPDLPAPPASFGAAAGGKWVLDQPQTVEIQSVVLGEPVGGGGGTTAVVAEQTTTTRLRWVAPGSVEVGATTDSGPVITGEAATFAETR